MGEMVNYEAYADMDERRLKAEGKVKELKRVIRRLDETMNMYKVASQYLLSANETYEKLIETQDSVKRGLEDVKDGRVKKIEL